MVLMRLERAVGTCSPVSAPSIRSLWSFASWSPDFVIMIDLAFYRILDYRCLRVYKHDISVRNFDLLVGELQNHLVADVNVMMVEEGNTSASMSDIA